MTARELRVGDRVTIGKGRTRYTLVVIVRPAAGYLRDWGDVAAAERERASVGVVVRNARTYWRGKARGRGRRVPLAKLSRVTR